MSWFDVNFMHCRNVTNNGQPLGGGLKCLLIGGLDNAEDVENTELFFTVSISLHDNNLRREQIFPYPQYFFLNLRAIFWDSALI
jgi:hypothetical protein